MNCRSPRRRLFLYSTAAGATFLISTSLWAATPQHSPPVNVAGQPVISAGGERINYDRNTLQVADSNQPRKQSQSISAIPQTPVSSSFVPAATGPQRPFWQYAIFGSGIGATNIVIGPKPSGSGVPEIIVGGNSGSGFGTDDFWQALKYNPKTANYDQLFVSPLYPAGIQRIGLANVRSDSDLEIVVMLADGNIYLYDFASKDELGHIATGVSGLLGLCLADLNGDGVAELVVTTGSDLYVFNGNGSLLWQVAGAGGYDVVVGQMDNDPALEIAVTSGKVINATTHTVKWTYNDGFGYHLALAPAPGTNYQQLIGALGWNYVYGYDVALQLPQWSIHTQQDIAAIRVADVNNDGTPELLVGDGQWGAVHVYDIATQIEKWHINNPEHGVTDVAVGDVDGDGVVDLLWGAGFTSTGADFLYVATTTGTPAIKWQSVDLEGPFLGPAIGDLDGDGQPELVVCSFQSNSGYDSGRILVFDLATLALRGISAPVINNFAWTGVHDLKLRDVDGSGRMSIVVAGDYLYDGAIEIYSFDQSNTFTRTWTNSTRPSGSPFSFVELADLDGNGTLKVVAANFVEHTGSEGVYVYVYDYPSGNQSWRSLNLATGFSYVSGLVVDDLNGNGSKEIAVQVTGGSLYTFDGPSRTLKSLVQGTGYTSLSSRVSPAGLVAGDSTGTAHFLSYGTNSYTQSFSRALGTGALDGLNILPNGDLWAGSGGALSLRPGPSYSTVKYQTPVIGPGFGRFVATAQRDGQPCVFSSARQAVVGLAVDGSVPSPTPTPSPTATPTATPSATPTPTPFGTVATLLTPDANTFVSLPQTFQWQLSDTTSVRVYLSTSPTASPGSVGTIWSAATFFGGGSFALDADSFSQVVTLLGPSTVWYWTIGNSNTALHLKYAEWRQFTTNTCASAPQIFPNGGAFNRRTAISIISINGGTIYYTIDGSFPSRGSPVYTGPFSLAAPGTVRAKVVLNGYNDSPVTSANFKKKKKKR